MSTPPAGTCPTRACAAPEFGTRAAMHEQSAPRARTTPGPAPGPRGAQTSPALSAAAVRPVECRHAHRPARTSLVRCRPPRATAAPSGWCSSCATGWSRTVTTCASTPPATRTPRPSSARSFPAQMPDRIGVTPYDARQVSFAFADIEQGGFDLVHDHSGFLGVAFSRYLATPMVHTVHCAFDEFAYGFYEQFAREVGYICISEYQRSMAPPGMDWAGLAYNAIAVEQWPYTPEKDDYLLAFGRVCEAKGFHHSIETAKRLDRKLIMAGVLQEPYREYFEEKVAPHIDGDQIVYEGEVSDERKRELFAHAHAFLFPITWPEPFGLVMIEAMACGTPVVAMRQGSVPEVVDEGVTGFVVDDFEDFVAAVGRVGEIDPAVCAAPSSSGSPSSAWSPTTRRSTGATWTGEQPPSRRETDGAHRVPDGRRRADGPPRARSSSGRRRRDSAPLPRRLRRLRRHQPALLRPPALRRRRHRRRGRLARLRRRPRRRHRRAAARAQAHRLSVAQPRRHVPRQAPARRALARGLPPDRRAGLDAAQQRRLAQGQGRAGHQQGPAAQRARAAVPLRAAAEGLLLRRRRRQARAARGARGGRRRGLGHRRERRALPPPDRALDVAGRAREGGGPRRARGDARRGRRRPPRRLPHGHPRPPARDALGRRRGVRPRSRARGARLLLPPLPPGRRQARRRLGHPARGHAGPRPALRALPGRPLPHPHPRHLPAGRRGARPVLRHGHGDARRLAARPPLGRHRPRRTST